MKETRRTSEWEKTFPHPSHSCKRHYRRQTPATNTLSDSIYPSDRWKTAVGGAREGEEILVSKTDLLEGHLNKMETAEKESNLEGI